MRSKYHLSLKEANVSHESLIQYKYNKYSLPKEFIGQRVGLVVQNNKLHIYYKGKIIEKHLITKNKLNIKKEHNLIYESRNQMEEEKELLGIYKILHEEVKAKEENNRLYNVKVAAFPFLRTIEDYDFSFQPSVKKRKSRIYHRIDIL